MDNDEATEPQPAQPTEPQTPLDAGLPTILVFIDEAGEIQIGAANKEFALDEMTAVLDVAKAKLDLVAVRKFHAMQAQQAVRSKLLQGVR